MMIEGGTRILLEKVRQGRDRGRHRPRRRERHRSRVLDSARAAVPRAQDHGQRGRRHGGRAVVCRRERHLHVSLDRRRLAQSRHQGGHGERREGGGDGSQQLDGAAGGAGPFVRRSSAVSSFGGTAACVDRVSERLEASGYEVIQFHASGVGGKSLERLASTGELAGVIDVTTHELADLVVDGVYSAGRRATDGRRCCRPAAGDRARGDRPLRTSGRARCLNATRTASSSVQRAESAHAHQRRGIREARPRNGRDG